MMIERNDMGPDEERSPRSGRTQLTLGVVGLLAGVVLVITGMLNHGLQTQVTAAQGRIANGQAAANVNNSLIRLLAKSAEETGDVQIRALLTRNGITSLPSAVAAGGAAVPATTPAPATAR